MTGTLYMPKNYYRGYRVLIAAEMSGKKVEVKDLEKKKSGDFFLMYEEGKVELFDPNQIVNHVSSPQIKGDQTAIDWANWVDGVISPAVAYWVYPCLGVAPFNPEDLKKAKDHVFSYFAKFDKLLKDQTYIVGERITQADITTACNLLLLFENVVDANMRKKYPSLIRWFTTMVNQPAFVKVLGGQFKFCSKPLRPPTNKDAQQGRQRTTSGSSDKSSNKKKQEKKAEKPAQQPQEPFLTAAEREALEAAAPKKEEKDPFLNLPKGSFVMDEWKRTYSNNDIKTIALPWFWQNFDKENYSIWFCNYKYNDELNFIFMSCNLIGGMFQRLDKMRKHAFSSMCVFGENKNNEIRGLWIWRGQELAFTLSEDLQIDYESYDWKKLDANSEETKKLVEQYFLQEFPDSEKKFADGKIYK